MPTAYRALILFLACFVISCTTLLSSTCVAQQIFDTTRIHEIRIEIAQTGWYDTLDKWYQASLNGADKQFLPAGITVDGQKLSKNSGIRFKGKYSNYGFPGLKKPFRINFNKYDSKQTLQGIKKVNLHNFAGDPSFLREYVSYDMFRFCGIVAPRTSYTKLYINNVYWGCYLIVEEPEDKQFLKQRFGTDDGNLFDNFNKDRLAWKGYDPELYDLKLQTDEKDSSWSNLFTWIKFFNTDSSDTFAQQVRRMFDMDSYLKILALDVYLNNWDSYPYDGRNFFIYDNPVTGKLHWIPWDYNLAMWNNQMALFPRDADTQYTYKPLIKRIHDNDFLRDSYYHGFCKLLDSVLVDYPLEAKTLAAYNQIKDAVETDTVKFYSNDAFRTNRTDEVTVNMLRANVPTDVTLPGITTLLAARKDMLKAELKQAGCNCDGTITDTALHDWHVTIYPNPVGNELNIYTQESVTAGHHIQAAIYTQQGKRLLQSSTEIVAGLATIDTHEFPAGIYILRLTLMGNVQVMKMVKL